MIVTLDTTYTCQLVDMKLLVCIAGHSRLIEATCLALSRGRIRLGDQTILS